MPPAGLKRGLLDKDLLQKSADVLLRTGIGLGVVSDSRSAGGVFVGEAVLGTAVGNKLPVGVSGVHFFDECGDLR